MTSLPDGDPIYHPGNDYLRGRKVVTSSVPIKDPYFATLKSVNYLPNALACMDGEQQGVDYVSLPRLSLTPPPSLGFRLLCMPLKLHIQLSICCASSPLAKWRRL